jgi:hypothetical protein
MLRAHHHALPLILSLLGIASAPTAAACPAAVFGDGTSTAFLESFDYTEDLETHTYTLSLLLRVVDTPSQTTVRYKDQPLTVDVRHFTPLSLARSMHHMTFLYGGASKFFFGWLQDANTGEMALIPMGAGLELSLFQTEADFDANAPFFIRITTRLVHRLGDFEGTPIPNSRDYNEYLASAALLDSYTAGGTDFYRIEGDVLSDLRKIYVDAGFDRPNRTDLRNLINTQVTASFMGDRYLQVVSDEVYPLWGFRVQPDVIRDTHAMEQFEVYAHDAHPTMVVPEGPRRVPMIASLPNVTRWQALQYDARHLGAFRVPLVALTAWFVASLGIGGGLLVRRLRRRGGRRPSAGSSRRG